MTESRREKIRENRIRGSVVDPVPVELPVNAHRPLTLREEMMRFIRTEISQQAVKDEMESFEDFDDFDIDDDEPDMTTPYTVTELRDEEGAYLLEPTEPEEASPASDSNPPSTPENTPLEGSEEPSDDVRAPADLTNNAAER